MHITVILLLLLATLTPAANAQKEHTDYVPDQKTAARMAHAILSAKFGDERVNALLPLTVDGSNKDYWIVQGNSHEAAIKGGGPAVWINKHSGCILSVTDHMK